MEPSDGCWTVLRLIEYLRGIIAMLGSLARKMFGTINDRTIRAMQPHVDRINALEGELEPLSDEDLKQRTVWFRGRLDKGEALDDLLPEAFATVREAAKRTLGQRHFDVQLIGGIVLHQGKISEMKTGEGTVEKMGSTGSPALACTASAKQIKAAHTPRCGKRILRMFLLLNDVRNQL